MKTEERLRYARNPSYPSDLEYSRRAAREELPGYSQIRPEIRTLIREVLADLKKSHLMEPSVAYQINTVTELRRQQLSLEEKPVVHDSLLCSLVPHAKELAVAVRTIDLKLEERMPLLVKAIQVNGGLELSQFLKKSARKEISGCSYCHLIRPS